MRFNIKTKKDALIFSGFLFLTFFGAVFMSCGDLDDFEGHNRKEVKLKNVLNALGGTSQISNLATMDYIVSGKAFEYEEEEPIQINPIKVRDYEYTLYTELNNSKVRFDYSTFESKYPLAYSGENAKIIINNDQGTISGQYDVASYYFGAVNAKPLYANRIEAILKNYSMSNPIELIKEVVSGANNLNFKTTNLKYTIPTKIPNLYIELYINSRTYLPIKASIKESDYLHGDTTFDIFYNNWTEHSGIMFPTEITYAFREDIIKTEDISNISFNSPFDTGFFDLEDVATPIPYDEELGKKGIYFSQWYHRFFDASIAIDFPLTQSFVAGNAWVPFGIPDQTIGENLKIIGRPDILYWGVAIKTSEGVIFVDPSVSPEWSRSMINTVQGSEGFPGEDIIGVVATHTHVDHFGGIREMAHEAETVYINQSGAEELESILNSTHSLVPDILEQNPKNIDVIGIDGITLLDNGAVELHSVNMAASENNPHSNNMTLVYVPEYQAIIEADLFNAGALYAIFAGAGLYPMNDNTKAIFKERAQFLLEYINENELDVTRIIGAHGGVASLQLLQIVAQ